MFKLFQTQIDNLDVLTQPSRFRHKRSWAQVIKSLLDNLGFSQMWHNQYVEIPCYELLRIEYEITLLNIGLPIYVTRPNSNTTVNLKRSLKWRSMLSISQMTS